MSLRLGLLACLVARPQRAPVTRTMPGPTLDLASGSAHACALGRDSRIRCWGDGEAVLGDGHEPFTRVPTRVWPKR